MQNCAIYNLIRYCYICRTRYQIPYSVYTNVSTDNIALVRRYLMLVFQSGPGKMQKSSMLTEPLFETSGIHGHIETYILKQYCKCKKKKNNNSKWSIYCRYILLSRKHWINNLIIFIVIYIVNDGNLCFLTSVLPKFQMQLSFLSDK